MIYKQMNRREESVDGETDSYSQTEISESKDNEESRQ